MEEPNIIYEEMGFLAVVKPEGMLVHSSQRTENLKPKTEDRNDGQTLVGWLLDRYPEIGGVGDDPDLRPGIVHRLDRDTSGVMLVAKNQEHFNYLKSLFQKKEIDKTYIALVHGRVKEKTGVVNKPISQKHGSIKRTVHKGKMEKSAVTEYRVIRRIDKRAEREELTLLEVKPKTGRTHQIRVHLASIGHSVIGDKIYGPKTKSTGQESVISPENRMMLFAKSLEFTTMDGRRLKIETELPDWAKV